MKTKLCKIVIIKNFGLKFIVCPSVLHARLHGTVQTQIEYKPPGIYSVSPIFMTSNSINKIDCFYHKQTVLKTCLAFKTLKQ